MEPVLTPVEMGAADQRAIAAGTPGAVLMERAGRAVAREVLRLLGGAYGRRVVVVCGKGNNGGDGLVVDRVLRGRGVRVDVLRLEDGIDRDRATRALRRAHVCVDAMYGTGFRGALEGDAAWVVEAIAASGVPVVAVDIPSGVDGATGLVHGPAVRAECTVTFAARKPGLLFEPGRELAGQVVVADIGIDVGAPALGLVDEDDVRAVLAPRPADAHKWSAAPVLVVGGSAGMTGAPGLVSRAAMRAGSGMVWCCVPGAAAAASLAGGEVIAHALPATEGGALAAEAAATVLEEAARFHALVLGPGLGRDPATVAAVRAIVRDAPVPLVLDADALNALTTDDGSGLLRARADAGRPPTVLTPHAGEFARLAGRPVGDDRVAAARDLAATTGAVVLLKGPGTVVAAPDGSARVSAPGGPWLATAGTGDVLAGIVGALVARGGDPAAATAAAAWLHGRAADRAGHTGLVAGDLVDALPLVVRDLAPSGTAS